jgi:hypothetical protein
MLTNINVLCGQGNFPNGLIEYAIPAFPPHIGLDTAYLFIWSYCLESHGEIEERLHVYSNICNVALLSLPEIRQPLPPPGHHHRFKSRNKLANPRQQLRYRERFHEHTVHAGIESLLFLLLTAICGSCDDG